MEEQFNTGGFSNFRRGGEPSRPICEYSQSLKEEITVHQELKVGDIVRLKGRKYKVKVTHVDYKMQGIGTIKYIGEKIDVTNGELTAFGQYDIEEILTYNEPIKEGVDR